MEVIYKGGNREEGVNINECAAAVRQNGVEPGNHSAPAGAGPV